VDNEETLRSIIASCIGSGRVSEPNCRAAGAQQIRAGRNRTTIRVKPKKSREQVKKRPRKKKHAGNNKKRKNAKKRKKPGKTIK
jgi:hypothetical protein